MTTTEAPHIDEAPDYAPQLVSVEIGTADVATELVLDEEAPVEGADEQSGIRPNRAMIRQYRRFRPSGVRRSWLHNRTQSVFTDQTDEAGVEQMVETTEKLPDVKLYTRSGKERAAQGPKPAVPRAPAGMRALPAVSALRVVVRVDPFSQPEEELFLLAAVEEFKRQHAQVRLEYATARPHIAAVLAKVWYLHRVHLTPEEADYTKVVGKDIPLTLGEPDPAAMEQIEKKLYDVAYDHQVQSIAAQQQAYLEAGMKDLKLSIPEYMFIPSWGRAQAYLWQLGDQLGISPKIPRELRPALPLDRNSERFGRSELHRRSIGRKPFLLVDLENETEQLAYLSCLAAAFPHEQLVFVREFGNREEPRELELLTAALRHEQCRAVIGSLGFLAQAAWAARIPGMLLLYRGDHPRWELPEAEVRQVLEVEKCDPEQRVSYFTQLATRLAGKLA